MGRGTNQARSSNSQEIAQTGTVRGRREPWNRLLPIFGACLLAGTLLVSCGDDDSGEETPDTAAGTVTPTATAPATPSVAPTRAPNRTGIPAYDKVIDAIERGDVAAVTSLVKLTTLPCASVGTTRPRCPAGSPDGTGITFFPDSFCEPAFPDGDEVAALFQRLIASGPRIHAAYRTDPGLSSLLQPPGAVALVFRRTAGGAAGLGWQIGVTDDGRVVASVQGCAQTPKQMLSLLNVPASRFILGPLAP